MQTLASVTTGQKPRAAHIILNAREYSTNPIENYGYGKNRRMAGKPCGICKHPHRVTIEARMAQGDSDNSIAKEFDLHPSSVSIHRLKHLNLSPARMNPAQLAAYNQALSGFAIASKANRVQNLQTMFDRIEALIQSRANDAAERIIKVRKLEEEGEQVPQGLAPIPGAETGLLSHEGEFDVYVIREYRSCLEQAAKELGEWDITGAGRRDDAASGAAQVTIQQVIHGHSAIAVSADPRPGARQIPLTREPLTLPEPATLAHSSQSVHQSIDPGEVVPGAAVRVDDGGGEG